MIEGVYTVLSAEMIVGWGVNKKVLGFVDIQENKLPVKSYKCEECGFLENYAK